jgi:polyferredoxin
MFVNMLVSTYLVFTHAIYFHQTVSLLWTFDVPWHWAYGGGAQPWIAQFAFGFYSIMLTSSILGIITLLLFKPRSWCVYCPMGTITQLICRWKHRK